MKEIEREGSRQRCICELLDKWGSMTLAELARHFHASPQAIGQRTMELERQGFITRKRKTTRQPITCTRTALPLPPIVKRKDGSVRNLQRWERMTYIPPASEIEQVFAQWVRA